MATLLRLSLQCKDNRNSKSREQFKCISPRHRASRIAEACIVSSCDGVKSRVSRGRPMYRKRRSYSVGCLRDFCAAVRDGKHVSVSLIERPKQIQKRYDQKRSRSEMPRKSSRKSRPESRPWVSGKWGAQRLASRLDSAKPIPGIEKHGVGEADTERLDVRKIGRARVVISSSSPRSLPGASAVPKRRRCGGRR
jgi:hypothetical protein